MNIRRYYVPNAIVFITQVVADRTPIFDAPDHVKDLHPFVMLGYVFLPDHLHLLLRPTGVSTFSDIMHSLKRDFTLEYKEHQHVHGPVRFWQKGFWAHVIRDVDDLQRHLDYIHHNPVRHGLVGRPEAWPHSSFRVWQARGAYPQQWGWATVPNTLTDQEWVPGE